MANKRVDAQLDQKELDFVKWLAKEDKMTVNEELGCLLKLQVQETMQTYISDGYYKEGNE